MIPLLLLRLKDHAVPAVEFDIRRTLSLSDCLLQRKKPVVVITDRLTCCNIAYIVRRFPFRFSFLLTYHKIIIKCKTYKRSNGKGGFEPPVPDSTIL